MKIAVIGGGVAGITAALSLSRAKHEVTLFEASARLGGHAHAVHLSDEGGEADVDLAFLIFNDGSYPFFGKLLAALGLSELAVPTDMSMGYWSPAAELNYAVNAGWSGLLAGAGSGNTFQYVRLIREILKFRNGFHLYQARAQGTGQSLEQFLGKLGVSKNFGEAFVYPTAAAVWSVPSNEIRQFPAEVFFNFFHHHRLLKREKGHQWLTLQGSTALYLKRFSEVFAANGGLVRLSAPVKRVSRQDDHVLVGAERFDRAAIATHANMALHLLAAPTEREAALLGAWKYHASESVLHTDSSLLPARATARASWNILTDTEGRHTVTYHLNRIQKSTLRQAYFLTLEDFGRRVDPSRVLGRYAFSHPVFTPAAMATQAQLPALNQGTLSFCGSYFGLGFHEDAIRSACSAAAVFGGAPL